MMVILCYGSALHSRHCWALEVNMEWRNPELIHLTSRGPLFYRGIEEQNCDMGSRFIGDFRTVAEKRYLRLVEAIDSLERST